MKLHIGEQTKQQPQNHLCKNALLPPFDLSVLLSRVSQIPRGSISWQEVRPFKVGSCLIVFLLSVMPDTELTPSKSLGKSCYATT